MLLSRTNAVIEANQRVSRVEEQLKLTKVQAARDYNLAKTAYASNEAAAKSATSSYKDITTGKNDPVTETAGAITLAGAQTSQTLFYAQQIASNVPDADVSQYLTPLADDQSEHDKSVAAFKDIIGQTPGERMRAQVLRSLGLTEDDLKNMTPEDRKKIEEKIAKLIDENVKNSVSENFTPASETDLENGEKSQLQANLNLGNEQGNETLTGAEKQSFSVDEQRRDGIRKTILQNII
ncbi:hypothetical protein WH96_06015 [Kiloniella spongiae]|uniref:Uncharacterized protein n=1 Tax=Kiloniella spongiae TaxID=1489064 RepID=A0A0H2MI18_9PROT|nr:hypothetical protein [Kiloniella spongiae]KLN61841.1 hypothetical protein WH96_06015 [Kiloniella spongiae]